jgi:TadE-like protein
MHGSSVRDTGEALRRAQIRGWLNEPLSVQVALVNSHTDGHAFEESVGDFNGPSTGKANQRSHRQRMASWCQSRVRQTGAAAVEFALILPVLLAVLIGSVDVSLALYDKAVITNASREGARAGIVARNPKLRDDEIRLLVRGYTDGALIHLGSSHPSANVNVVNTASTLDVTVSYTFEGIGLGSLFRVLGQPWVLTSNTVMVHE